MFKYYGRKGNIAPQEIFLKSPLIRFHCSFCTETVVHLYLNPLPSGTPIPRFVNPDRNLKKDGKDMERWEIHVNFPSIFVPFPPLRVGAPRPEEFLFHFSAMEEAPTVDATAGLARPELNFSSGVVGKRVEGLTCWGGLWVLKVWK